MCLSGAAGTESIYLIEPWFAMKEFPCPQPGPAAHIFNDGLLPREVHIVYNDMERLFINITVQLFTRPGRPEVPCRGSTFI